MSIFSRRESQQKEQEEKLISPHRASTNNPIDGSAYSIASTHEVGNGTEKTLLEKSNPRDELRDEQVIEPARALEPDESSIRLLAYLLWQERGDSNGSPEDDWFRARKELQRRSLEDR